MNREIKTPLTKEMAKELRAGDYVTITGTIYTARDAAHKRMIEALDAGEKYSVLYGTFPGQRRPSDWFRRSNNGQPYG